MLLNCGVGEDSWESLGLQGDPTSPSWRRSALSIHWMGGCWSWSSNTLAIWCEDLTHWKRPWCWGRLRARGEEGNRGWDCWMASSTQWTWVWADSGRSWRSRKPDAGKDWRQEKKGITEDEMVEWDQQLNRHEFEQASGVGDRQGSLACCSPWVAKVRHAWVTVMKWTDIHYISFRCITQWFSYLIHGEMTTINLVNSITTPKVFL